MSSKKQLIIDCGLTHICAGSFLSNGANLSIDNFADVCLDYDYSNQEQWAGALRDGLKVLTKTRSSFKGQADIIVPASLLLTKTIKIPFVNDQKRAQLVAYEAQQNIPYPLAEVVWDWQVISDDGVEIEILLLIIKRTDANMLCDALKFAGIEATSFAASTILDYNACKFISEEDTMFLNVGARTTNLTICGDNGFFVRSIPFGGNRITQGIADMTGKTFSHAQKIKLDYFARESYVTSDEKLVNAITKSIEQTVGSLNMEITRSVINYRRQNKKSASKIILAGRCSLSKEFVNAFSAVQKLPVEIFDPSKGAFSFSQKGVAAKSNLVDLSQMIGLACSSMIAGVGVNLIPQEILSNRAFNARKPKLIIVGALLAIAPILPLISINSAISQTKKSTDSYVLLTNKIKSEQQDFANIEQKFADIENYVRQFKDISETRLNWTKFLSQLQASLTNEKDVWIENLTIVREDLPATPVNPRAKVNAKANANQLASYKLELGGYILVKKGEKTANARQNSLINALKKSDFIIGTEGQTLDLDENLQSKISTAGGENKIYKFNFVLNVDPNKKL